MNTPKDPPPVQLAVALEQRGFESLWYGEHSHIPCSRKTPYPPGGEMPDPYKLMMDLWGRPDAVLPMIDDYVNVTHHL